MLEGELPKLGIFIWVHGGVVSRMLVSSVVSEPDIIPFIGEHEPRSLILIINEEGITGVKQAMLHNDGL